MKKLSLTKLNDFFAAIAAKEALYLPGGVLTAVLAILIAVFCEWMLYCAKELLKPRGLWLTCAFFSVILCTAVSLICNFPAP